MLMFMLLTLVQLPSPDRDVYRSREKYSNLEMRLRVKSTGQLTENGHRTIKYLGGRVLGSMIDVQLKVPIVDGIDCPEKGLSIKFYNEPKMASQVYKSIADDSRIDCVFDPRFIGLSTMALSYSRGLNEQSLLNMPDQEQRTISDDLKSNTKKLQYSLRGGAIFDLVFSNQSTLRLVSIKSRSKGSKNVLERICRLSYDDSFHHEFPKSFIVTETLDGVLQHEQTVEIEELKIGQLTENDFRLDSFIPANRSFPFRSAIKPYNGWYKNGQFSSFSRDNTLSVTQEIQTLREKENRSTQWIWVVLGSLFVVLAMFTTWRIVRSRSA
jgi:hypothetical protein